MKYKKDTIDLLVYATPGEADKPKPLFFFCQGSLPKPLVMYSGEDLYGIFPFSPDILAKNYHLVIVGKPGIPLMADVATLDEQHSYIDAATKRLPEKYSRQNLLSYYVPRNLAVIDFLRKQKWVKQDRLVVAGHSEGSTIAAKMAASSKKITHLIYSGGNPMGRITSMIATDRRRETDTTRIAENTFQYWQSVIANRKSLSAEDGDTPKATFEFSQPAYDWLKALSVPVLISFGTRDYCAPYNDFLRVDMLRRQKKNFHFLDYLNCEHNYFPVKADGSTDWESFKWDRVAADWLQWLN